MSPIRSSANFTMITEFFLESMPPIIKDKDGYNYLQNQDHNQTQVGLILERQVLM